MGASSSRAYGGTICFRTAVARMSVQGMLGKLPPQNDNRTEPSCKCELELKCLVFKKPISKTTVGYGRVRWRLMLLPSVTWTQEPCEKTLRCSLLTSRMDLVHHPSVDAGESIKRMKSTEGHKTPLVGGKVEEAVVWAECFQASPPAANVTKIPLHYFDLVRAFHKACLMAHQQLYLKTAMLLYRT